MATIPTSLPIPSEDPRDLKFNAGKFDEVMTSDAHYYVDRFGVKRFTIAGFQFTAEEAIRNYGYITMDSFEDGATLTLPNQALRYEATGEYYRWDGLFPPGGKVVPAGSTPATSGGVGTGAWLSVGDATLRSNLASQVNGLGDALVGVKQPFTGSRLLTQHDLNARVINVDDFDGVTGDGIADDTAGIQAAFTAAAQTGGVKTVVFSAGKTYKLPNGVDVTASDLVISGYGAKILYGPSIASYYHCFRITGVNVTVRGLYVFSPSGLVRDDTGFAFLFSGVNGATMEDVTTSMIASAGVWTVNSSDVHFRNVRCNNHLADGIHISNNTQRFSIIGCSANGCHDDSIAVVKDVPADPGPSQGLISGCIVTNNIKGHAFVAIGCYSVTWSGNTAMGCAWPGFGSYFWQLTASPTSADWVSDCAFINNTIVSCGINPTNESNASGFFVGALRNCTIKGNKIYGAPAFTSAGTNANCMLISNAQNLLIDSNEFHSSNEYGVYTRDANIAGAPNFTDITISNNIFRDINYDAIHFYPTATIGAISIINNTLVNVPQLNTFARSLFIGKTGSALLTIAGNKNIKSRLPFVFDAATSTNVSTYSNTPAIRRGYTANLSGQGGAPTGSVSAYYTREGDMVFVDMNVTITAINGATNPTISLPFPVKGGMMVTGRIDSVGGQMLQGILENASTLRLVKYDNTGTFSGLTAPIAISARLNYIADI